MYCRSLRSQRGDASLFMVIALMLCMLAFAMGLSDDVNRRLKAGRTDDQTAYVRSLADRLTVAYNNLLRTRGGSSYSGLPLLILDQTGSITGTQLLTALGEMNPRFNVQSAVTDLLTVSPCSDTTCSGISGSLTYRKIALWIPPVSHADTSAFNGSNVFVPDPDVSIWVIVDGTQLQATLYSETAHRLDTLSKWLQQYFAARLLEGGSTSNNYFRASDCTDSVQQTGLPCFDSSGLVTTSFLQTTGLQNSDFTDAWGGSILITNSASDSTLTLTSTQTQSNSQVFTTTRQINSP